MADLYTSLVRAKQELNGGTLPAMTPIPENVQHFIDPAFTPGLGALEEHPEKGLRCPVRGCGRYYHRLTQHIDGIHGDIGGQAVIKKALDIPPSVSLITESIRAKFRAQGLRLAQTHSTHRRRLQSGGRNRHAHGNYANTAGMRNFRNTCLAQVGQRILSLRDELGRPPSAAEARMLSPGLDGAAIRLYGTWNNALASLEMSTVRGPRKNGKIIEREAVLESLQAWYATHGSLPAAQDAVKRHRLPYLHCWRTYLRALGADSWPEAMRIAASMLGIRGGRYGLPKHEEAA